MGFSAENAPFGGGSSRPAQDRDSSPHRGDQPRGPEDGYRALLDLVLQQTLASNDEQTQERLESLDELLEVARRRRGQAFALDPVGIELVQTVLRTPFRALVANEEQWRAMTRDVAQTLCDDPASNDRLSALWRRLNERCGNGN